MTKKVILGLQPSHLWLHFGYSPLWMEDFFLTIQVSCLTITNKVPFTQLWVEETWESFLHNYESHYWVGGFIWSILLDHVLLACSRQQTLVNQVPRGLGMELANPYMYIYIYWIFYCFVNCVVVRKCNATRLVQIQ